MHVHCCVCFRILEHFQIFSVKFRVKFLDAKGLIECILFMYLQDDVLLVLGPFSVFTDEVKVKDVEDDPDPDEISKTVVFWFSSDKS